MWAVNPNRSRSGPVSAPDRVVAPTSVNGATSSGIVVAPGPLPTTTSTRKSSIARYSISSAGRASRWISSMNTTSPSASVDSTAARSPDRSMAGPLVIRSGMPSSAAMIMAIVVLPSPGGPDSSTWSGGRPRRSALSSTSDSWSRTRCWPTKSASRLGRSAVSMARASRSDSGDTTRAVSAPASRSGPERARARASASAASRSLSFTSGPSLPTELLHGRAQHGGHVGGLGRDTAGLQVGRHRLHRLLGVAGGPAQVDQAGLGLLAPGRRRRRVHPGAVQGHVAGGAEPVLQLQHDALRALLADARDQGQRVQVAGGHGPAQRVRAVHGQHGQGQPRADPGSSLQQLEDVALVVAAEAVQGERLLAYDQAGGHVGVLARPQRGQRARRALDAEADPAALDDRAVGGDPGDRATQV